MQARTGFDMVWTTGVGNNPPFVNAGETASSYNGMTGSYCWLHSYTGKKILVDESAGASQQADTWSDVMALDPNLTSTCPFSTTSGQNPRAGRLPSHLDGLPPLRACRHVCRASGE
jgi:hypothetical protein